MDNRKKMIMMICVGLLIICFTVVNRFLEKDGDEPGRERERTSAPARYAALPDAEVRELPESKSDAYMRVGKKEHTMERNAGEVWQSGKDDLYAAVNEEKETEGTVTPESMYGSGGSPAPETGDPRKENPYRETPEEREARHRRRREEAMDLAQQMAAQEEKTAPDTSAEGRPRLPEARSRKSGIISSLDDGWNDGISSFDGEDPSWEDDRRPYRCMFAKESKIRNGQRVSVILLEDMTVDGFLIPKNTHLMANCRLGARMEMEILNLETGGRIIPLGFEAYDIDGSLGIYCPDVGNTAGDIRKRATAMAGSRLGSLVGGLAREIVNTGSAVLQQSGGEETVTVPAAYTFFILRKAGSEN